MADLSNLIYPAVLSDAPQSGGVTEPRARRSRPPRRVGAAARLAPLVTILALSLAPLSLIAVGSLDPATHAPIPAPAYGTAWSYRPGGMSASGGSAIRMVLAK